ncbi:tyrosine-type recombinase/integrase [Natrononativus amylolyticus]|uniref:tyrosine-type recombinase/integrase n=1 Tax=Natrononativus amylolyticus TaxID=2963434 RepID=UPI0020CB82FD|nr:tyrosine-type recombinase/integrase [Natrononativus amylolyticus]
MQLETYDNADGRRVRLTETERDRLLAVYDDEPTKQVALAFMARCGCRVREATDVRPGDVYQGDETGQWFLRIPEGKGEKERQTPMPTALAGMVRVLSQGLEPDDRVLEVTPRTVRRWVGSAAAELAEREDDDRWRYVGPHDLRRTWGHLALEAEVLPSVLMQWGGWDDYETFQRHYLGKHSESVQAREAKKVNWL